jgi:hypothetical protein
MIRAGPSVAKIPTPSSGTKALPAREQGLEHRADAGQRGRKLTRTRIGVNGTVSSPLQAIAPMKITRRDIEPVTRDTQSARVNALSRIQKTICGRNTSGTGANQAGDGSTPVRPRARHGTG